MWVIYFKQFQSHAFTVVVKEFSKDDAREKAVEFLKKTFSDEAIINEQLDNAVWEFKPDGVLLWR